MRSVVVLTTQETVLELNNTCTTVSWPFNDFVSTENGRMTEQEWSDAKDLGDVGREHFKIHPVRLRKYHESFGSLT
jgi:hypothetical protein